MEWIVSFFQHVYAMAEVYTVVFAWIVIPLGYYAAFLFFRNHYGMFVPPGPKDPHGSDR